MDGPSNHVGRLRSPNETVTIMSVLVGVRMKGWNRLCPEKKEVEGRYTKKSEE